MKKIICFDMDGTIADLYNVNKWLEKIEAQDPAPYAEAKPMWNMTALAEVLTALTAKGWEIRVITWLAMHTTEAYKEEVRKAKKEWLDRYNFPYDRFHGVAYGATKFDSIRKENPDRAILIDDNAKVRSGWNGETIDPTACDIIERLTALL